MALRIRAAHARPDLRPLPWDLPLEEWGEDICVELPQGISRHVVRMVRLEDSTLAIKETRTEFADREFEILRTLRRLDLPVVEAFAVVHGRGSKDDEPIEPALVTVHLRYSLPYRALFSHGLPVESLHKILDALAVLLVRLHLAGFFWGDVSLSNVLFRRSAGAFVAYLVDGETGEFHDQLSSGQRSYDLEMARINLYGEILDLQAGDFLDSKIDPEVLVDEVVDRYAELWEELTATEVLRAEETWRIEQRIDRLNAMGFDVAEVEIVTDYDGATVRMTPRVVEAGHHRRELQRLVGLEVEENQARRLLTDLSSYATHLGIEDRSEVAHHWLIEIFDKVWSMVPEDLRGEREPAEVFHEVLEHRWLLSERAGHEVDIFDTTEDYIKTILRPRHVGALD
jgi:tRNA A-37 threonylcarbamoyl transferase component Bud32